VRKEIATIMKAEAFFSTLKTECFPPSQLFGSKARREIFEYIELYYNNRHLHSALGYLSDAAPV
jgi:putative transposase